MRIRQPIKFGWLLLFTVLMPAGMFAQETEQSEQAAGEIEEITVVGSRRQDRSAADSPVPVDVIDGDTLLREISTDMDDLLTALIPSYNVNTQPISDAATFTRPASLRALPPDSTLVLVNGKRRHRGAVLVWLGAGNFDGSQGPDLASIPSVALQRVEVLRDGASSQYGSDAIAGVLNFVLREDPNIRHMQLKTSQHYEGDGIRNTFAGIVGMPFGDTGVVNFSFEYGTAEPTSRSIQRDDAIALIAAGNTAVRQPAAQIWGSPEIHYDWKVFVNAAMDLADGHELYAFGNYSARDVEGGFYYRNPLTRGGVFTLDGGATLAVADYDGSGGIDCPTVTISNNVPDPVALAAVNAEPNCYSLISRFPGGFTPQFGGELNDQSFAVGIRGEIADWKYDASIIQGHNGIDLYIYNTINPQLLHQGDNIPTFYRPGIYDQTDRVINLDLSKPIDVDWGDGPLFTGLGVEFRNENFQVTAGEQNSWSINNFLAEQGFGIGSNGFAGAPPSAEIDVPRDSYAAYIDVEQNLSDRLLTAIAFRFEDYDDFGSTFDGKLAFRYEVDVNFAIRGAVSTGFRAPTAGQANIRNVTTAFVAGPHCASTSGACLSDQATLPPTHPAAALKGGKVLQPEVSINRTAGFVVTLAEVDVTVDAYQITLTDRIALTSNLILTGDDIQTLLNQGVADATSFTALRYFTNDFDTTTTGVDLIATTNTSSDMGSTNILFVGNYTKTEVDDYTLGILTPDRVEKIKRSIPEWRYTLTVDHAFNGPWSLLSRMRYYGEYYEDHLDSGFPITDSGHWIFDIEASYDVTESAALHFGLQNVLDNYPDKHEHSGVAGAPYPLISPFGFNGGLYYLRLTMDM